jgi:hypothetical protein
LNGYSPNTASFKKWRYVLKKPSDDDPFEIRPIVTTEDVWLQCLGIGLYLGEGNRANKWSIRLGNTDHVLLNYSTWAQKLEVPSSQFFRPTVTVSGLIGSYQRKSQCGIVTAMYRNIKLRDIMVDMLPR